MPHARHASAAARRRQRLARRHHASAMPARMPQMQHARMPAPHAYFTITLFFLAPARQRHVASAAGDREEVEREVSGEEERR